MNYLILKIALRIFSFALVGFLALSVYYFYIYIHPSRWKSQDTPASFDLKYEDITLNTEDGVKLSGWFIPCKESDKAIIVCHGYPTNKANVLDAAVFLAPYYNLFLFDFRGLGESAGKFISGGWREKADLLSAVNFLKGKGFKDIGALGFSMGGAAILMSDTRYLKAIVSDSAYANLEGVLYVIFKNLGILRYPFVKMMKLYYRLLFATDMDMVSPSIYISKIKVPILLIHGGRDSQIPVRHLELLHQRNPDAQVWVIPDAEHGEGLSLRPQEYKEKILKFFRDNL